MPRIFVMRTSPWHIGAGLLAMLTVGLQLAGTLAAGDAIAGPGAGEPEGEAGHRTMPPILLAETPTLHRPFAHLVPFDRSGATGSSGAAAPAQDSPHQGYAKEEADRPPAEERFHAERSVGEDPHFLYLHESADDGKGASPSVRAQRRDTGQRMPVDEAGLVVGTSFSFTPRVGLREGVAHSLDLGGRARPIGSFTPRYREASVSLTVNPPAGRPDHALGIEVGSQYLFEGGDVFGYGEDDLLSPIERRAFHVGLSVNYQGFSLGAGVSRDEGGLDGGRTRGFDVGFGWRSGGFETTVSLGGFTRSDTLSSLVGANRDENFYRLELGAAYQISRRLRVSGGVRLFDYSSRLLLNQDLAERSGVLYLGTRLRF